MVRSMTGFGRGECQDGDFRLTVEIRSVNHRFLEISSRLPRSIATLENRIRERVQGRISRGKLHVAATLDGTASGRVSLRLNEEVAALYLEIAQKAKARFGLRGDLELPGFLGLPDILEREEDELTEAAAWGLMEQPLDRALDDFDANRAAEGAVLARDLRARLASIREAVGRIAQRQPEVVGRVAGKLRERLAQISQDTDYNRFRLESEVILYADRSDITEECVRMGSHLEQFEEALSGPEAAGRRLNFILQEMNREANTIGSKSQDVDLGRDVIFVKEEIEKIRQQVQNIE